ncbi:Uncharacterized protein APZ42_017691 [Daphnia magna]|uniref:DDE-1 domain-containing protein n=1 Tax=Daphnia magna TaxID=35525 RepID=A0A165A0J3_9CRUS|nr:Uncharacterized protein APZ42_017691 [Daphnia magna]
MIPLLNEVWADLSPKYGQNGFRVCGLYPWNPNAVKTSQATSYVRATAFNKHNVSLFFDNLNAVLVKHKIKPRNTYHFDETGITACHKPGKVILLAEVAKLATGNKVLSIFFFLRKKDNPAFLHVGPIGSISRANGSGWMRQEDFLFFMKHFVLFCRLNKENKVLLLVDNHHSHLSLDVIDFFKQNSVVMLTLPPHCTHKLQPLDRSVFVAFKSYYNTACTSWMVNNYPGLTMKNWPCRN